MMEEEDVGESRKWGSSDVFGQLRQDGWYIGGEVGFVEVRSKFIFDIVKKIEDIRVGGGGRRNVFCL